MISNKTKYALKALLHLADQYGNRRPLLIMDLAKQNKIPKKFLELILLELKNKGLLASKKGKGGGYFLGRDPHQITLGEVIPFLDDVQASLPCLKPNKARSCEECADLESCGIRMIMKEICDSVSQILHLTTLSDLLDRSKRSQAAMYHI